MPQEDSAGTRAVSEGLAKNLSNWTLYPSTKSPSLPPKCLPQQQDREKKLKGSGLGLTQGIVYRKTGGVRTMAGIRKNGCLKLLYMAPCLSLKKTHRRGNLRLIKNQKFRSSCSYCQCPGILLIILAWRILTWNQFSYRPYSCTYWSCNKDVT